MYICISYSVCVLCFLFQAWDDIRQYWLPCATAAADVPQNWNKSERLRKMNVFAFDYKQITSLRWPMTGGSSTLSSSWLHCCQYLVRLTVENMDGAAGSEKWRRKRRQAREWPLSLHYLGEQLPNEFTSFMFILYIIVMR